jgi:hypothetical protein
MRIILSTVIPDNVLKGAPVPEFLVYTIEVVHADDALTLCLMNEYEASRALADNLLVFFSKITPCALVDLTLE